MIKRLVEGYKRAIDRQRLSNVLNIGTKKDVVLDTTTMRRLTLSLEIMAFVCKMDKTTYSELMDVLDVEVARVVSGKELGAHRAAKEFITAMINGIMEDKLGYTPEEVKRYNLRVAPIILETAKRDLLAAISLREDNLISSNTKGA